MCNEKQVILTPICVYINIINVRIYILHSFTDYIIPATSIQQMHDNNANAYREILSNQETLATTMNNRMLAN